MRITYSLRNLSHPASHRRLLWTVRIKHKGITSWFVWLGPLFIAIHRGGH